MSREGAERQPLGQRPRNTWIDETALSTALNVSFMADRLSLFSIVVGFALLLTGISFVILTAIGQWNRNRSPPEAVRIRSREGWRTLVASTLSGRRSPSGAAHGRRGLRVNHAALQIRVKTDGGNGATECESLSHRKVASNEHPAYTVIVVFFVLSVLTVVAYALFEMSPFARHADCFRDPLTGKRLGESPRLD